MQGYLSQVKCLQLKFDSFDLLHVPKSGNAHADSLAIVATSSAQDFPRVSWELIQTHKDKRRDGSN